MIRRTHFVLLLVVFFGCEGRGRSGELTLEQVLEADWSTLEYQVATRMPAAQKGGTAIVLLHGYGSQGSAHSRLADALANADSRVFLPTAVLPHPSGGAMWWEFLEDDWPKPLSDSASANAWPKPSKQLPPARDAVIALIDRIRREYQPDRVALAGHSQGAMLALDVAMLAEPPIDRVAALAGYVLLDSVPNMAKPRDGKPLVFIAHGRNDAVVGFDAAERMKRFLGRNGFSVTFRPHSGDHAVSAATVSSLREFLLQ